ncbi:hypothetical protein ACA910_013397 [Epithemia clementina (nom. ined.)]
MLILVLSFLSNSSVNVVVAGMTVLPRHCGGSVRHVHLAVGPDPSTSMIVSFASISSQFLDKLPVGPPVGGVRIGTQPDQLSTVYMENDNAEDGESTYHCYNITTLSRGLSNDPSNSKSTVYWSPYYHHVVITGLKPSTTYYYQPVVQPNQPAFERIYGPYLYMPSLRGSSTNQQVSTTQRENISSLSNQTEEGFRRRYNKRQRRRRLIAWGPYNGSELQCPSPSKIRMFRTAPVPSTVSATFAILGDLGQFPHSQQTMERLLHSKHEIDAAILAGDIAYTGSDHRRWDTFFDFFDDYMAFETIPLQICPGNHDIDKYETSDRIFLAYQYRFRMPQVQPAQLGVFDGPSGSLNMDQPPYPLPYEYGNSYYSWKYAGAHFIMVNAYASMEMGSMQRRFINKELQKVKREITPWVIVVIHTPLYNTFGLHLKDPQIIAAKENLEPLFVEYNVNIVFSGHIHAYSRSYPVAMNHVNEKGPVHITVGAGGRKCEAPFGKRVPEDWVAVRDATMYGFGMFRIHNATTAEWDWIHTSATDDDRDYNQLKDFPDVHLAAGPPNDHVYIANQYYL